MEKTQAEIAAESYWGNKKLPIDKEDLYAEVEWNSQDVQEVVEQWCKSDFIAGYNSAPQLKWKKISEDIDNELSLVMDQIEDMYVDWPLNQPKGMYAYAYYIPYSELLQLEKEQ